MMDHAIPSAQRDYFNNKTVLVIVPHQDDEINLAGGLLNWLFSCKNRVYVMYTTNGHYRGKGSFRIKEAVRSVITLGGSEENVIFLGYSDQAPKNDDHLYTAAGKWTDRRGNTQTFLVGGDEYCFKKHGVHHEQNRINFISDIKEVIEEIKPDIIYAVDFDSHADHRAASLGFEHAMGEILRSHRDYHPAVYKSFAYPLTYSGKKDFFQVPLPETQFNAEKCACRIFQNPYYQWDNRIRFHIPQAAKERFLPKNILFRALCCHKSQNITERADRIINSDQAAWFRRTDNLLCCAEVNATSGEVSYLSDFLLFDCSDIMNGGSREPIFDAGVWMPSADDAEPVISIRFDRPQRFDRLVLYRNITDGCITEIKVRFDNREEHFVNRTADPVWTVGFDEVSVDQVEITVVGRTSEKAGLTELELLLGEGQRYDAPYEEDTSSEKLTLSLRLVFIVDKMILFRHKLYHSLRRRLQKFFGKY